MTRGDTIPRAILPEPRAALGRATVLLAVGLVSALLGSPASVPAQEQPRLTVTRAALSADTIMLGDRFELEVGVRLTPGSVAFLPDSIVGRGFEPFGPVAWSAEETADGGTLITARWPLIAFGVGTLELPEFEVYAADAEEARAAGMVREDAPVGSFDTFADNVTLVPSARLRPVPSRSVWVASVLIGDEVTHGMIAPRPAADVAGSDRDWTSTLLGLVFGVTLLAVGFVTARDWSAARSSSAEAAAPPTPGEAALASLDALLGEGLHRDGRTRAFYDRSSTIVRRFVESMDARWGPAWTSTELMTGLTRQPPPGARPDPVPLSREMQRAEAVKFGGVRPDAEEAERHIERLRSWIREVER